MVRQPGAYLGTEIGEKWWRRYGKEGLFMRGNGKYWLDGKGLYFLRYLTRKPLFIPFSNMREIRLVTWHAGKWIPGWSIVKILWERNGKALSSGFVVSRSSGETLRFKELIEGMIHSSE